MKSSFGTKIQCSLKALRQLAKPIAAASMLVASTWMYGQSTPADEVIPPAPSTILATGAPPAPAAPVAFAPVTAAPVVAPVDSVDVNMVPAQAPVIPNVVHEIVSSDDVFTVHLRPLFTTVVRLPEEVTSIAVGAPTLIDAEYNPAEPLLVDLKPMTYERIDSDVVIALRSGHTLSIRVISGGEDDGTTPVDFVVDYAEQRSLFLGSQSMQSSPETDELAPRPRKTEARHSTDGGEGTARPATQGHRRTVVGDPSLVTDSTPVAENEPAEADFSTDPTGAIVDVLFREQEAIAAPHYFTAEQLARAYPEDRGASPDLQAVLGRSVELADSIVVAYSVVNHSNHWVEILPPSLQFNNPNTGKKGKVNKKHPDALAEQLLVSDYRMSRSKLAPGERLDGDIEFVRPGFKYRKEHLLLQIASASEVDAALLFPIPFVPAGR